MALLLVLSMYVIIYHLDKKQWNNGVCTECGYKYKFINSNIDRHFHETYTFQCEKCGKIITMDFTPY